MTSLDPRGLERQPPGPHSLFTTVANIRTARDKGMPVFLLIKEDLSEDKGYYIGSKNDCLPSRINDGWQVSNPTQI